MRLARARSARRSGRRGGRPCARHRTGRRPGAPERYRHRRRRGDGLPGRRVRLHRRRVRLHRRRLSRHGRWSVCRGPRCHGWVRETRCRCGRAGRRGGVGRDGRRCRLRRHDGRPWCFRRIHDPLELGSCITHASSSLCCRLRCRLNHATSCRGRFVALSGAVLASALGSVSCLPAGRLEARTRSHLLGCTQDMLSPRLRAFGVAQRQRAFRS